VHLGPGVFMRDIAARKPLPRNIVETEIRRNFFPAHALVSAAEHMVASCIEYPTVVRRKDDWERPGKTVSHVLGCDPERRLGPDVDQLDLPSAMVVALQRPGAAGTGADRAAIDDVRVFRMHGDKAAFSGAGIGAVPEGDGAPGGSTEHGDRGVVLLCGIRRDRDIGCRCRCDRTEPSVGCKSTTRSGRRCSLRMRRHRYLRSSGWDR